MDEAVFVTYLKEHFPFSRGRGIGDDASTVTEGTGGTFQLITKDLLIDNVHFSRDYFSLHELALKSLAVNLSDIAAMGGDPQYFYLGLGYPPELGMENLYDFFNGLEVGCRLWNVELAGGDFSTSATLTVSITMVGQARHPVYRDTACAGDLIGITGLTGQSAIGLQLLRSGQRTGPMVQAHKHPQPRIAAGKILAGYANAMIDVSDGLLLDLKRMLTASGKGGRIAFENLPVTSEMRHICRENQFNLYEMVLAGGEDYELLFTISRENEIKLRQEECPYIIIGTIDNDSTEGNDGSSAGKLLVQNRGQIVDTTAYGYDHFKKI